MPHASFSPFFHLLPRNKETCRKNMPEPVSSIPQVPIPSQFSLVIEVGFWTLRVLRLVLNSSDSALLTNRFVGCFLFSDQERMLSFVMHYLYSNRDMLSLPCLFNMVKWSYQHLNVKNWASTVKQEWGPLDCYFKKSCECDLLVLY